jgi:DNA gyrase subunit A
MIINKTGITIRLRVEDLRVVGRATQGVKLINLRGNDEIAAVCTVLREEDEEIEPSDDVLPSDANEEPSGEEEGTSDEPLDEE